jgi:FkbM family methyltransferase
VRVRDGYVMLPREDPALAIMVANAASGGLEPGTRRVLQALIQPGMTVADIGANVGLLTLACARATGPTGKVYAFEPEARSREQLVKMLQLNGLTWVQAFDLAVGRRTEKAAFHLSPVIGHSSLHALPPEERAAGRITQVNVARLDDILPAGTRLDVVKIDVEGAELDVLAGMSRLIADNPDIALVAEFGPSHLDRLGVDAQAWLSAFTHAGFRLYEISELDGTCASADTAALLNRYSVNLAMVRPGGGGEARLPR